MRRIIGSMLAVAAMALTACGGASQKAAGAGDMKFGVSFQASTNKDSVASVIVTVTDFATPANTIKIASLTKQSSGDWSGLISNLPAGSPLNFIAQAFDASSTLLYEGSGSATPIANTTSSLKIFANEVAKSPFANNAPIVQLLFASADTIAPGAALTLDATAIDLDADPMTFAWSLAPDFGTILQTKTYDGTSSAVTDRFVWTAPATEGVYNVAVAITDGRGGKTMAAFTVTVSNAVTTGSIAIQATLNDAPRVNGMTLVPNGAGTQFALTVSASDTETPTPLLAYTWTTIATPAFTSGGVLIYPDTPACNPSLISPSGAAASFDASSIATGTPCTIQVTVFDGNGASNTGSMTFMVGQPTPQYAAMSPTYVVAGVDAGAAGALPQLGSAATFTVSFTSLTPVTLSWATNFSGDNRTQTFTVPPTQFTDSFTVPAMGCTAPVGGTSVVTVLATYAGGPTQTLYTFDFTNTMCP